MTQKPEFAWASSPACTSATWRCSRSNIFAIPLFVQMIKVPYRILAPP